MPDSLWIETAKAPARPVLEGDVESDVAIVGGGILGITAAHLLKQAGLTVTVVEAGSILAGVTGHTTAKVTSQHGTIYSHLDKQVGRDAAKTHAEANEWGKEQIARNVDELGIDADFVRAPAYVYSTRPSKVETLRKEADVAAEVGLPASFTTETGLPFSVQAAVRFEGQAHFHPRKYLLGLAQHVDGQGSAIYENSRVRSVHDGKVCRVETDGGAVHARHTIVATNVPISDRAFFVTRMKPHREYGAAFPVEQAPDAMYVNTGSPRRSVRPYEGPDGPMLIVAGEKHPVGHDSQTQRHWSALTEYAQEHFGANQPRYEWSTQDYYPVDGYPMIGKYTPTAKATYTATGFQGWGMTQATAAALIIKQKIVGEESPWADLYDPFAARRVIKDLVEPEFVKTQMHIAKKFVSERLVHQKASHLAPGQGEVAEIDGKKLAVHRDREGKLHAQAAQCTHMGCFVAWNEGEQSWDCPCHGSRFADGRVLHGPATKPLAPEDLDREGA